MSDERNDAPGDPPRATPEDIAYWFNRDEYECARSFGFAEWYVALELRLEFERRELKGAFDGESPETVWDEYDKARSLTSEEFTERVKVVKDAPGLFSFGTIQELNDAGSDAIARSYGSRVLAVNTSAPHEVLCEEFEKWVAGFETKEQRDSPRTGPKADNARFTEQRLSTWKNHHVLECLDIDAWARIFGKGELYKPALCRVVLGTTGPSDAKGWGIRARGHCQRAFLALPLLIHEVAEERKRS